MEELHNNPYFTNGVPDVPQDDADELSQERKAKEEGKKQYSNPDDEETFYNARNWVYGRGRSAQEEQDGEEELEERIVIKKPHFIRVSLGLAPLLALDLYEGGIPELLHTENHFFVMPFGAVFRFEYLNAQFPLGWAGPAMSLSYNYMWDKQDEYLLTMHYGTASILYTILVNIGKKAALSLHAGAGIMLAAQPTFAYDSGYKPETYTWVYPQATGGIEFSRSFSKYLALSIGTDLVWPFLLSVPFPTVQAHLALEAVIK